MSLALGFYHFKKTFYCYFVLCVHCVSATALRSEDIFWSISLHVYLRILGIELRTVYAVSDFTC